MFRFAFLLLTALFLISCKGKQPKKRKTSDVSTCASTTTSDREWYYSGKKAPLFKGLAGIDFKISTTNEEAQQYFNQGMMLCYGFNHAEAARSFFEAMRLDSTCAMAHWGFAYALGPNYNAGMENDNYQLANDAVIKAKSLSIGGAPLEIELIKALSYRYQPSPPADRSPLNIAYANAMKKVYEKFPAHPDIGALYADALMNLHPWDLYDNTTKQSKEWTPELVGVLEQLMKSNPKHPGAHHFYIHAVEASSAPQSALNSAKLLDTLVPGAGHLLHMPSHIYINTGDYHLATQSNLRAIAVDSAYTIACYAHGIYPLAYYPHNYHFLAATAALEGNSSLSFYAAERLQQHLARDLMEQPEWSTLQHYYTIPYYIAVKFGMWDKILSFPAPPRNMPYPNAIWHYAKGLAYIGKKEINNAQKEAEKLEELSRDSSLSQLTVWNINTMADLVQIANKVLAAAINVKNNDLDKSIQLLQEAVTIEDKLNYNEPPDWFFSVRHHLGAVLLRSKNYEKAAHIYVEDLKKWKKNGWALLGLHEALLKQKKISDAKKIMIAFNEAWKYADTKIQSSSAIFY
ncbi:tetratricopeptide repeat protein [Sphingobacterium luzhongxinii]|uniref:tetratricopeptide repeat protein n=1 Tax=Sphingobacterium luzhongxinii TaxID=2654181 RepID=UPI0013D90060|nr:tetratricopeptide repeat protein [Sphingobacterium sp. xlx-73]